MHRIWCKSISNFDIDTVVFKRIEVRVLVQHRDDGDLQTRRKVSDPGPLAKTETSF